MVQKFSVQLKNEPRALATLAEPLADRDTDIRAIGAVVVGKDGYTVFTTNNDAATREVLRGGRYRFTEGEAVSTYIENRPGSLAQTTVSSRLSASTSRVS